jgi:3-oxoacyl-[acyl-carrier-protein] synthase-3
MRSKIYSNITKAASACASICLTNDDLIKKYSLDTTCDWIESRTGIKQRYFVQNINELEELATKCAHEVSLGQVVDGIIVATSTNKYNFPGISQIVHKNLGLGKNARALDINAACNGFMMALSIANLWIKHEGLKNVIVIGAEAMSTILDMKDKTTCCLFGDGAGAILLSASNDRGLIDFHHMVLSQHYETLIATDLQKIQMNGRAVFETSVPAFQEVILNVLTKCDKKVEDIDLFILHQANARIFSAVARNMKLDESLFPFFGANFANTSAATIPMALAQADFMNKTVLLSGFGAGFTTSATVLSYVHNEL